MPSCREPLPVHSAHVGEEREVHYRWHPHFGRKVTVRRVEHWATGQFLKVEDPSGIVVSITGWLIDPLVCAGMRMGSPQVDLAALSDLKKLVTLTDDLGPSASGTVARPGFDRLVAWLCAGKVGAVLCQEASRLARNGRDWHHLLELCGLVEARVIDHEGAYNPCQPNDRLLLGSMAENPLQSLDFCEPQLVALDQLGIY